MSPCRTDHASSRQCLPAIAAAQPSGSSLTPLPPHHFFTQLLQNPTQFLHRAFEFAHRFLREHSRFRQLVRAAVALVLEPGDVEAVATLGDPFAGEAAEAARLASVLALGEALRAAERVITEGSFELGEVLRA